MLDFLGGDGVAHDQHGGEQALPGIGDVAPLVRRRAGNIHRHHQVGAPTQLFERQRIGRAAVDQDAAGDDDRPHHGRQRDRGRKRRLERPRGEHRLLPPIEVGRDDGQGNFELAEIVRHLVGQELLAEFFRVNQRGAAEAQVEEIGKRARARRDQAAKNFGAVMGERDDEAADLPARHPRRVGGCDQGADGGAGDGGGLLAHIVERFQHRDVGEPARAAAAEREGETLCHRAPASRANSQALTASGRTSGAMAAAFSLVAVPSRTRPTMPWKIAARRKKL